MMNKIVLLVCAVIVAAGTPNLAHGAQEGHPVRSQTEVTADAISQAQNKLTASKSLLDQINQAKTRSLDIQADIRATAALLSARTADKTAEQMRQSFAGNVDVANAERRPCADPPPSQPTDGPGLCQPGVGAH
jgi:small-conductance mechanosensitive channel